MRKALSDVAATAHAWLSLLRPRSGQRIVADKVNVIPEALSSFSEFANAGSTLYGSNVALNGPLPGSREGATTAARWRRLADAIDLAKWYYRFKARLFVLDNDCG